MENGGGDSYLELLGPVLDVVIVFALVLRVEVGEGNGRTAVRGGDPDLAEDARVDVAHEDLADGVEAVCWIYV